MTTAYFRSSFDAFFADLSMATQAAVSWFVLYRHRNHTFDICLLLYDIRLAGWRKHLGALSLSSVVTVSNSVRRRHSCSARLFQVGSYSRHQLRQKRHLFIWQYQHASSCIYGFRPLTLYMWEGAGIAACHCTQPLQQSLVVSCALLMLIYLPKHCIGALCAQTFSSMTQTRAETQEAAAVTFLTNAAYFNKAFRTMVKPWHTKLIHKNR